ncbi:MAG: ABC-2 family transporter protein [Polyangiales bacterium]
MSALRLYGHYARISVRAQLAYPGSAALLMLGQVLNASAMFAGVWSRFDRFGDLRGYRLAEVALFYGFVNAVFSMADAISRGFDVFGPEYVKTGEFDRLLLRPRSTLLQLFGHEIRLSRFGRLVQSGFVIALVDLPWSPVGALVFLFAFAGGVALFCGILIMQATLSFWTIETLEVVNVISYGGVEAAQYPLNVYGTWLRRFLTFGVPIAAVSYYPLLTVLGREDPLGAPSWLGYVSPLAGFLFFGIAALLWRIGVRRYTSTGS